MKRKQWIRTAVLLAICLMFAGLTACESVGGSEAERLWKTARKEDSFEEFIMGNASKIDTEALRQEAQVRAQIMEKEDGTATLCLTLEDGTSPLLHVALLTPNPGQAGHWAAAFKRDPSALYHGIINLLN